MFHPSTVTFQTWLLSPNIFLVNLNPEELLKSRTPSSTLMWFSCVQLHGSASLIQSTRRRHWRRRTASCSWKCTMKTCRWRRPRGSGLPCAGSAPPADWCWSSRWSYSEGSSGPSLVPSPPAETENSENTELESDVIMTTPEASALVLENPSRALCCRYSESLALDCEIWPLLWFWSSVCTAQVHTSPPAGSCSGRPSGSPSRRARGTALWDLSKGAGLVLDQF